jgi:hypothetical protein
VVGQGRSAFQLFVESEVALLKLRRMVILRQYVIAQLMSGIDRNIIPDPRQSLVDRHLPNTPQVQRLLRREDRAHVFNDRETLGRVTQAIIAGGERTSIDDEEDDYERYGLYFSEPIGYIIKMDGSQTPLYYGEIKIVKSTGEYHAIPRTSSRRTS